MPSRLQFIPVEEKNPISIQFSESYRRKERAYSNNYLRILEPDIHERQEMKHWALKSVAKPEHIQTKICRIWKVKLKSGQFEDDDSNIVTGPKAPKIGMHYLLHEVIDNPASLENGNAPWQFPLSTNTFEVGKYLRPKFNLTTDARGNITKSVVSGGSDCWYLEFSEKEALKILSEYEKDDTFTMLVVGDDHVARSVSHEREWFEGSIDDLADANKGIGLPSGQTYLTKEYGGLNRYLTDKAEKIRQGQQQQKKNDTAVAAATSADNTNKRSVNHNKTD